MAKLWVDLLLNDWLGQLPHSCRVKPCYVESWTSTNIADICIDFEAPDEVEAGWDKVHSLIHLKYK